MHYGFAVPGKNAGKLLKAVGVTLQKGEKVPIQAEVDGEIYYVQLTSLDLGEKYRKDIRIQVRYGTGSEIVQHFREVFGENLEKGKNVKIQVYALISLFPD